MAFRLAREHRLKVELNLDIEQEKKESKLISKKKKLKEQKDEDEEARCKVWDDSDEFKIIWDNSVLILAVINAFAVPVELSVYQELSEL